MSAESPVFKREDKIINIPILCSIIYHAYKNKCTHVRARNEMCCRHAYIILSQSVSEHNIVTYGSERQLSRHMHPWIHTYMLYGVGLILILEKVYAELITHKRNYFFCFFLSIFPFCREGWAHESFQITKLFRLLMCRKQGNAGCNFWNHIYCTYKSPQREEYIRTCEGNIWMDRSGL